MVRSAIIIGLLISFCILAGATVATWRGNPLPEYKEGQETRRPPFVMKKGMPRVRFYPVVPATLPDMNKGYLFNEARLLEEEGEGAAEDPGQESGDLDGVLYTGSIISGDLRKGMVSFPEEAGEKESLSTIKRGRGKASKRGGRGRKLKVAILVPGDTFRGYSVAGVYPDKIVFSKDGEKVEKTLYDPDKKRLAPPPLPRGGKKAAASAVTVGSETSARPKTRPGTPPPNWGKKMTRPRKTVRPDHSRDRIIKETSGRAAPRTPANKPRPKLFNPFQSGR